MWALYRKEINGFFSSLTAYITIGVFLLVLGLMLWVFPNFSLLRMQVVTLQPLFSLAPVIFIFLLPALTMNIFSEEKRSGTFELLMTRPVSDLSVVTAKYTAVLTIVVIALVPTVLYFYTMHQLGAPQGNIDGGQVAGSYVGLFFLASIFAAVGMFGSALSKNQIVSFIISLLLCTSVYWGGDLLSSFPVFSGGMNALIESLGVSYHYFSISRGLIDSRDVIYFLSVISIFGVLTLLALSSRNWK